MVGVKGLDQDSTAPITTARATRDLSDELKRLARRAIVGQMQRRVSIDHTDQRDVGKVEPLGDHLCPQQDVDLVLTERIKCRGIAARSFHRVGVHAQDSSIAEACFHFSFELLRPQAREF